MTTTGKISSIRNVNYQGSHRSRGIRDLLPTLSMLTRCALPLAALVMGMWSLTRAHESAIGQYGLIQALPLLYFLSLVMISGSFIIAWRGPKPHLLEFALSLIALVILLQSAPGIIESEPRFEVAWLHAGFTNYVAQTGDVLPKVDARFSWPSFFTGMAMIDRAGGLPNAILLIRWWPVVINLLYLPPLYLLSNLLLRDRRKAMLAVWLFPFTNWVGQDYYSPQSAAYLLYLVLLCVVLGPYGSNRRATIFRRGRASMRWLQDTVERDWHPQALGHALTLLFVMLMLCAAIDTGHQLTPIFAIATVALLVFFGRTRLLAWPGVMLLLAVGWVCYAAIAYWSGHLSVIFGGLSSVGGNYSSDLRLHGNVAHSRINDVRLLIFAGVWALALIGFFLSRRVRVNRVAAAVIMLAPLLTVAGQSYGGEAGLRAFLFSLPGALCLAAVTLASASTRLRLASVGALTIALIPGFLFARWGNELSEMATPGGIAAVNALYRIAPPGSTMVSITPQITWEYEDIGEYQYAPDNLDEFAFGSVSSITAEMTNPRGDYVVITTSQLEYAQEAYGLPPNWGAEVERKLRRSHTFRLIYSSSSAKIYQYTGPK
jgi:hypothetical protein